MFLFIFLKYDYIKVKTFAKCTYKLYLKKPANGQCKVNAQLNTFFFLLISPITLHLHGTPALFFGLWLIEMGL